MKKILSLILSLCLIFTLSVATGITASAAQAVTVLKVCNVDMLTDSASAPAGVTYDSGTNTLTLTNANLTAPEYYVAIFFTGDLTLNLIGTNTITESTVNGFSIQSSSADNYGLTITGSGSLNVTGTKDGSIALNELKSFTVANTATVTLTAQYRALSNVFNVNGTAYSANQPEYQSVVIRNGVLKSLDNTITAVNGSKSASVKAAYSPTARTDVYCVDIAWGSLEFNYTDAAKEWNTTTHTWDTKAPASWALKDGSSDTISVTNHSSCVVGVTFSFAKDSTCPDITGTLEKNDTADTHTAIADTNGFHIIMPAASGATVDSFAAKFAPGGSLPSTHTSGAAIGTVTVTVSDIA